MTINVLMNGVGKMGTAVAKRLLQEDDINIISVIDPNPSTEEGLMLRRKDDYVKAITDLEIERLFKVYSTGYFVMTDFSNKDACLKACLTAAKHGINIVSGTTPISKDYEERISKAIAEYSVSGIRCPNFSVDVNKFLKEMEAVGKYIDPLEHIAVYEMHRLEKLSTSGTAGLIARILCQHAHRPGYILLREGKAFNAEGQQIDMPELKKDVLSSYIQVSAIRFADEPGTHIVQIGDENNYRRHMVRATRASYVEGAYRAVRFLSKVERSKQYSFPLDVLGF